jgi:hypothetical protein
MLPIYKGIQFQKRLEKGGRTKPWLIIVNENGSLSQYVVKMFTQNDNDNNFSLLNEVAGNVLAQEFGIKVPKAALIEFDDDFINTIGDPELEEIFLYTDERLKFATKLLNPSYEYSPNIFNRQQLRSYLEIDSIFAFDVLIQNGDRTTGKPNLLFFNKEGYLIDHELGFNIATSMKLQSFFINPQFMYHIFYDYLCDSWNSTKKDYFNEFCEYLKLLNVNNLSSVFRQLNNCGFHPEQMDNIRNYLLKMKRNCGNFETTLGTLIGRK